MSMKNMLMKLQKLQKKDRFGYNFTYLYILSIYNMYYSPLTNPTLKTINLGREC